jgi:hypothetical protein
MPDLAHFRKRHSTGLHPFPGFQPRQWRKKQIRPFFLVSGNWESNELENEFAIFQVKIIIAIGLILTARSLLASRVPFCRFKFQ